MMFHLDGTRPPKTDKSWIWVFGSNLAARHGKGAALVAHEDYGASPMVSQGLHGRCYAIPTKDRFLKSLTLDDIQVNIERFIRYANHRLDSNNKFWITSIGCGLAGYEPKDIAPMFEGSPSNCSFPDTWAHLLDPSGQIPITTYPFGDVVPNT